MAAWIYIIGIALCGIALGLKAGSGLTRRHFYLLCAGMICISLGALPVFLALLLVLVPLAFWIIRGVVPVPDSAAAAGQILADDSIARLVEICPKMDVDVLIMLPTWNESECIAGMLRNVPREVAGQRCGILVVDDASTDRTAAIVREHGTPLVVKEHNLGIGNSNKTGMAIAARQGIPWLVTMDADGQHRYEDLGTLLAPLLNDEADLVIGSRNLGRWQYADSARKNGVAFFNFVLRFLTGYRTTDCTSGFRAFRVDRARSLEMQVGRHYSSDMIMEALRRGLRLSEVPVAMNARSAGQTKQGSNLAYGLRYARTMLRSWWRHSGLPSVPEASRPGKQPAA